MGRDGIAGLAVLVASLALYRATFAIESNPLVPVSPAFYPRLVLGTTAILSLALLVSDVLAVRAGRRPSGTPQRLRYGLVAILFAIFAVYVLALPYLGFRVATFAFLVVMQSAIEPPKGWRRAGLVAAVALATTLVTYYTFDSYLQVLLPRGLWTGF